MLVDLYSNQSGNIVINIVAYAALTMQTERKCRGQATNALLE
jgi:hypothetical protein